jgi:PAS domain S-box-containing protein
MKANFFSVSELRKFAEERVPATRSNTEGHPQADVARLVYELDVHQVELEIQNEELRRAHALLQDSIQRYTDLYEFAPVGYLTINVDGSVLTANLTAATLLGRERSKLVGTRLGLFVSDASKLALSQSIDQVLLKSENSSCEVTILRPDGVVDIQVDINRDVVAASDSTQCRVTMTDISKRRRAERESVKKDARLRALANALPVMICYVDKDLRIQFSNPAALSWLGHSSTSLENVAIDEWLGEAAEEFSDYVSDAIAGRRVDFEMRFGKATHDERVVQMMLVPDRAVDGTVAGIHSLGIDITERLRLNEQDARRRRYEERLGCLTASEKCVYELLIRGKSNKAIAFELDLGLRTAERRRKVILEKMNVESLSELLHMLSGFQGMVFD